ncbi:type II toxin-antitoxin system VapC family toxin [Asticcacaulis sp. AND118]|uniref:type II toxin-antitoxin system VapC family toxin n=1 Tax=Asticcacaulis sp. AND118 TaxID=2840468 RepID=UPI001D001173|nr:type II toxin-antitoxin system VapC family toxin [Asticcacaulis sp. AND118]UDF04586.1 type II toxin-antitoxin system VapC family toxin [Asticcacaulis sp. AND118]
MKLLLDTHILLWAAGEPEKLPQDMRAQLEDSDNTLLFSAASLWEVAIKRGLGRDDFQADPRLLRRGLLDNGYVELPILSAHAVMVDTLPAIHKDPFDRILIAQSLHEGIKLITVDPVVMRYFA